MGERECNWRAPLATASFFALQLRTRTGAQSSHSTPQPAPTGRVALRVRWARADRMRRHKRGALERVTVSAELAVNLGGHLHCRNHILCFSEASCTIGSNEEAPRDRRRCVPRSRHDMDRATKTTPIAAYFSAASRGGCSGACAIRYDRCLPSIRGCGWYVSAADFCGMGAATMVAGTGDLRGRPVGFSSRAEGVSSS
jgi:hypothetical protein